VGDLHNGGSMASDLFASYAQLGFSFAVCIYTLYSINTTIKENTKAITDLREEIIKSRLAK